ncbi:MAG: hypothetical protein ACE5EX_07905, partial [Phycisphaerae bacterium]
MTVTVLLALAGGVAPRCSTQVESTPAKMRENAIVVADRERQRVSPGVVSRVRRLPGGTVSRNKGVVPAHSTWRVVSGETTLDFRSLRTGEGRPALSIEGGVRRLTQAEGAVRLQFSILPSTDLTLVEMDGRVGVLHGRIRHQGGLKVIGPSGAGLRAIESLSLVPDSDDRLLNWMKVPRTAEGREAALRLLDTRVVLDPISQTLFLVSKAVYLSADWADGLGLGTGEARRVGTAVVQAALQRVEVLERKRFPQVSERLSPPPPAATSAAKDALNDLSSL